MKRFVICEINEKYLKNVKRQMKNQGLPLPKDDSHITITHKPVVTIDLKNLNCDCEICKLVKCR